MSYPIFLALHNLNRWLVLAFGAWALYRLARGWRGNRAWSAADRRSMRWFALIFSVQFVLGAILYLLPGALVSSVLDRSSMHVIMRDRVLRFFTLEHPLQMTIAIGLSHTGNAIVRRLTSDRRRFKVGTILMVVVLLLILIAIPWPFLSQGRPLLRLP
ncbi:MAG TPA: hypothetical protein VFZ66_11510 [Herpetosiphonaceae bacterium]